MTELDQAKVEAFTQTMTGILNGGTLALMTSIGHQTGLFEVLAKLLPSTSAQIAEAAGLNERYVREWLNTMAAGKIVGCGEGHSTDRLAHAYPHSRFTGYDLREGALEEARAKAASLGLRNVRFVRQDLSLIE